MTRSEILQVAKSILFNTEMVRAILDGRKTVTRRVVRYKYDNTEMKMKTDKYGTRLIEIQKDIEGETHGTYPDGRTWRKLLPYIEPKPPYKPGYYLYVPEAWKCTAIYKTHGYNTYGYEVEYKDGTEYYFEFLNKERFKKFEKYLDKPKHQWQSPYFMPKEAARVFLWVTNVRVERLQDITEEGAKHEGANYRNGKNVGWEEKMRRTAVERFAEIWDSTVPPKDRDKYGWAANPWVWKIAFEKVEVTE